MGYFEFSDIELDNYILQVIVNDKEFDTIINEATRVDFSISTGYVGEYKLHYDSVTKKYGYIDDKGDYLIRPQFNEAGPFVDCIALVFMTKNTIQKNKKGWYYINKRNEIVMPPRIEDRHKWEK